MSADSLHKIGSDSKELEEVDKHSLNNGLQGECKEQGSLEWFLYVYANT